MVASCLTTAELGFGLDAGTGFDSVFNARCSTTGLSFCFSDVVLRATGGAFLGVGKTEKKTGSGIKFILIMQS